jgi:sulfate adenylyltransferase subunit 1
VCASRFGPALELRGYQGRVESGVIAQGDTVVAWPSGLEARVVDIVTLERSLPQAGAGRSVTVVLDRQIDIARGDLLAHAHSPPTVARRFGARLAWLDREPLSAGGRYWLKHGTQAVRARIEGLESRLDLDTMALAPADTLAFNDVGSVRVAVARPVLADPYAVNRATGSFILVDEGTNHTVAGGMIDALAHSAGATRG